MLSTRAADIPSKIGRTHGRGSTGKQKEKCQHRPNRTLKGIYLELRPLASMLAFSYGYQGGGSSILGWTPQGEPEEGGVQHTQRERLVNWHALLFLLQNLSWSHVLGRIRTNQSKNVSIQCHPLKRIPTSIHEHVQYVNMLCPCVGAVGA